MKELKGKFYKTSKGYDSYEIFDVEASFIFKIAIVVVEVFQFTHADPLIGFEQVFMDLVKDEVTITIGWDIWSGCFVTANDPKGGAWILQIGNYLDGQLNSL
ncbi:hypothetical protein [Paenibacillus ferrarius]|uniref:hypothetical protein n=1 Tax=Paenibacillus ferrarius TaxID=1469647 RepID=UPI00117F1019|nr:hypothetical protein [Paenibacillus ferrarius]